MTTRGFTLYQLTALMRTLHSQGHTAINCNATDELDSILGETHYAHYEWSQWRREYNALVAQRVIESPVCPKCGNVRPVYVGIPDRVIGATLVRGCTLIECGVCKRTITFKERK